ncbi:MAG: HAMP domain-containing protein [Candidatus Latescibacterota bacterium]|nr:MAG: HAMP domain-containing protein [Candidatus Latescibacterota bacterium]
MMSIRSRLIIMCVVISLLPAIPLSFLVRSLIEKSFNLGLSPTVENALQSGLAVSRAYLVETRREFETGVADIVSRTSDPSAATRSVAAMLEDLEQLPGGVDGFVTDGVTGAETSSVFPKELSMFSGSQDLRELVADSNIIPRRGARPPMSAVSFFETEDRAVQLALWRLPSKADPENGQEAILFFKRTDPEFLTHAEQLLEGRQIFAQLRLSQPTLGRSFFYPFVIIYGVILLFSLALALLMAERMSNPIRRLAQGANVVAEGDWSHRIRVRAGGEIGRLVRAFNEMVSRLDTQRRRLIDMEKMASWREVARHLAHEIKNPLLPIRLTVQEMKDQYKGDDESYQQLVDESVRVVGDELEHLQNLVKEFSSFAKMPELSLRQGSLGDLVQDVAKLYPQAVTRIDTDPNLGESVFDSDQMRRVLVNLLDNAVSVATDSDKTEVAISLERQGDDAVLAITDNGPGISPEDRHKIFEPYFTTREEGSGLGLAMVKNIVLLHGGSIDVQSEEGQGATFTVTLPLGGPVNDVG